MVLGDIGWICNIPSSCAFRSPRCCFVAEYYYYYDEYDEYYYYSLGGPEKIQRLFCCCWLLVLLVLLLVILLVLLLVQLLVQLLNWRRSSCGKRKIFSDLALPVLASSAPRCRETAACRQWSVLKEPQKKLIMVSSALQKKKNIFLLSFPNYYSCFGVKWSKV